MISADFISQAQGYTPKTAEHWSNLVSQQSIDNARRAAESKFSNLTQDDIDFLRWKAKNDLYYLADAVLGYRKVVPHLHGNIVGWLLRTWYDLYRMILLPRSYYKTTLITITDSVQISLPSIPGDESSSHPVRSLGSNARILLGHESHTGSSRFLYEITSHFCANPKLIALFPECVPTERLQRMNQSELELPRDEYWAEPTFDTMGVGARSQGRHYDWIKLDDIYGDKARDSKAIREATIQWFDNIQSFLVSLTESHIDLIGTRYAIDDVYGHAIKVYDDSLIKYIRRIEEYDKKTDSLVITFPEKFTPESIRILKKNPKVWIQYSNHPTEGLTHFEPGWKRFYEWKDRNTIIVFTGHHSEIINVRDLDIVIFLDPARTGKNGIVITGMDSKGRIFILDCIKDSFKDPEIANLIFSLVSRWQPRAVVVEEVLFSGLYKPWLEAEMKLRNNRFYVQTAKRKKIPGTGIDQSKDEHIKALGQYFSAGLVFFHDSQKELLEEYDNFGATDDVHMLDALAYGPQIWRPGITADQMRSRQLAEEKMMDDRDVFTGYSAINYD